MIGVGDRPSHVSSVVVSLAKWLGLTAAKRGRMEQLIWDHHAAEHLHSCTMCPVDRDVVMLCAIAYLQQNSFGMSIPVVAERVMIQSTSDVAYSLSTSWFP